eukprot:scaffold701_cov351-Prasinococcus_capsulatus_cf.AAC.1
MAPARQVSGDTQAGCFAVAGGQAAPAPGSAAFARPPLRRACAPGSQLRVSVRVSSWDGRMGVPSTARGKQGLLRRSSPGFCCSRVPAAAPRLRAGPPASIFVLKKRTGLLPAPSARLCRPCAGPVRDPRTRVARVAPGEAHSPREPSRDRHARLRRTRHGVGLP